jgi:type IV secretion system protein VirD4
MNIFRSERARWATPIGHAGIQHYAALPALGSARELYENGIPRGALLARMMADRERLSCWMSPGALLRHRFRLGQIMVGKIGDTKLGYMDDRPMVTIAGARAGKSSTVLEPNLYLYPGSMLVLDPKRELIKTAAIRRAMGHTVHIVDPYGPPGSSACFNCLAEIKEDRTTVDQVTSIVSALVPDDVGGGNAKHFNDCARALLLGIFLLTLSLPDKSQHHLITVRELLTLSYPPLVKQAADRAERARRAAAGKKKTPHIDLRELALETLLESMVALGTRFGGVAASIGMRFLNTPVIERGGVFSTAAVHTDFLNSLPIQDIVRHSDFSLRELRSDRPTTIYLVLPVGEIEQQFRWLRLLVQMACTTLEKFGEYPKDRPPILFLMEEFAVLGRLNIMQQAAAYFPGFGVKLWIVLQGLQQLIDHYKSGHHTFLGNAGLIQMFAPDDPALDFAAKRLGKLIEPFETRQVFSRQRNSQLLLMEGQPAAAAMRLDHGDVDLIRRGGIRIVGV